MTMKKATRRGFTLVELMIVVAIIGVLAALAIYGVRRYVYTAKTAEAKEGIGRIAKDASSSYNAERMPGTVLSLGSTAQGANQFCAGTAAITAPAATLTIPDGVAKIQGKKYQSSPTEWEANVGTECLGFSMQDPQYYAYGYSTACTAECDAAGETFSAVAMGDLDGDTVVSTYTMAGSIQTVTGSNALVLTVAPNFVETDPLE